MGKLEFSCRPWCAGQETVQPNHPVHGPGQPHGCFHRVARLQAWRLGACPLLCQFVSGLAELGQPGLAPEAVSWRVGSVWEGAAGVWWRQVQLRDGARSLVLGPGLGSPGDGD